MYVEQYASKSEITTESVCVAGYMRVCECGRCILIHHFPHLGATGRDGRDGSKGRKGEFGSKGSSGRDGRDGTKGSTGDRGRDGSKVTFDIVL